MGMTVKSCTMDMPIITLLDNVPIWPRLASVFRTTAVEVETNAVAKINMEITLENQPSVKRLSPQAIPAPARKVNAT